MDTRILVDKSLENLGYNSNERNNNFQHIYREQPKFEKERIQLSGKRPDYVIYSEHSDTPIMIIETKRKGERIDKALSQGIHYAKALNAPIVFATDGVFCKSHHVKYNKTPLLNGEEIDEFIRETLALKFLNNWELNTISPKVQYDRKELIKIFDDANNLLRGEGLRAGIERFGEFANILFLKLVSENEDIKKEQGINSDFNISCHWDTIKNQPSSSRINYINKIVYKDLNNLYKTDIFTPLQMNNKDILKEIMDNLDPLVLNDIDSDVKGDAFEYFLKASTASGNDLGEYFTPRHIVKTMVKVVNPQFGERIYDPFCGTGGLLIESFRHIWNIMPRNAKNNEFLRQHSIYGNEITNTGRITKMNMILAGDGHSNISIKDSLANPVDDKFDIVLTNMPYSQKTKYGKKYDVPTNNGDSVCVQHCIRAIDKTAENGRMALVVPEGFLFRKDLQKTREYLLDSCNLRSIISLPQGVFLPYTGVKTNIIYCDKVKHKDRKQYLSNHFWYFNVKFDGYSLDNHRRKLTSQNDLDYYQEYRKLDDEQKEDMMNIGFELIPFKEIKDNECNLVGSYYRESTNISSPFKFLALSEIFTIIKNGKNVKQIDDAGKLRVSRIQTISDGQVDIKKTKWTNDDVSEKDMLIDGDILFSHINSYDHLAKTGIVKKEHEPLVHGTNILKLRPNQDIILPMYAFYIFKSSYFIGMGKKYARLAVNQASIRVSDIKKIKIPIPSLDTQEKIVNELVEYQTIVDASNKILQSYFPTIKIEDGWEKTKLVNLLNNIKPGFACGQYSKGSAGIPHLRPMNISDKGGFVLEDVKSISVDLLESKNDYLLENQDILFNNTNSKELVGKTTIVTDVKTNMMYSNHITRLRCNKEKVLPQFLSFYLHNLWRNGYFLERCKKWIGQAGIDLEQLKSTIIYLPKLDEQKSIIEKISLEIEQLKHTHELGNSFQVKINDRLKSILE